MTSHDALYLDLYVHLHLTTLCPPRKGFNTQVLFVGKNVNYFAIASGLLLFSTWWFNCHCFHVLGSGIRPHISTMYTANHALIMLPSYSTQSPYSIGEVLLQSPRLNSMSYTFELLASRFVAFDFYLLMSCYCSICSSFIWKIHSWVRGCGIKVKIQLNNNFYGWYFGLYC